MEGLFSKRYAKALKAKEIPSPSFSRPLRKRLAMVCGEYDEERGEFERYGHTEADALHALKMAYGKDTLRVQDEATGGDREAAGFSDFVVYAYPDHMLDAIEAFYRLLSDGREHPFQVRANAVLAEENSPWRLCDGRSYLVDSRFLDALKDQMEEEMKSENLLGAHEEFRDARSHLQTGDSDVAIQKANCAFESALKSLLNQREGSADDLLKRLRAKTDLLDGIPDEAQKALVSGVLQGLPILRHKLGGHGQGAEPISVPRAYGDLAVNLAATYIKFLLDLRKDLAPPKKPQEDNAPDEEDIPF